MATAQEMLYEFARNETSIQDARGLLLATGFDPVEVQDAINALINDPNTTVRWTNAGYPRNANIFITPLDSTD